MEYFMIRGRGLGVAGWERVSVPHRRIRRCLNYRLFLATEFSPHTVSGRKAQRPNAVYFLRPERYRSS